MTYRCKLALIIIPLAFAFITACSSSSTDALQQTQKNASPIEVVEHHFEAMRTNDIETWMSTMTSEKQQGFSDDIFDGLKSVTINEIFEVTGDNRETRIMTILQSEKAKDLDLIAENIAIVQVKCTAEYDLTKSPFSGTFDWEYILIRGTSSDPWLIQEWGVGNGGI